MKNSVNTLILSPATIVLVSGYLGLSVNIALYSEWGTAHTLYIMGILCFCVSHMGTSLVLRKYRKRRLNCKTQRVIGRDRSRRYYIAILALLSLLSLATSVLYIIRVGFGGANAVFFNLRYAHTQSGDSTPSVAYFGLFALALALLMLYRGYYRLALAPLSIALLASAAYAERTSMLMSLLAFLYLYSFINGLRFNKLVIFIGIFLILSVSIAIGAEKTGGESAYYFIFSYLGFGLEAFQIWIQGNTIENCPSFIFGIFGRIAESFYIREVCAGRTEMPAGEFNVFTYMHAPYIVFGPEGVLISMSTLGVFYAVLFNLARSRRGAFLLILSCMIYPLVMVFYAWQFHLTTYIYLAFIFIIYFSNFREKRQYYENGEQ